MRSSGASTLIRLWPLQTSVHSLPSMLSMGPSAKADNAMDSPARRATVQPLGVASKPKRAHRRDKSDLGENFVAPDGGWAWLVCVAAGISNLSIYPCLQQFGFMFRERLTGLGMSSSEITTIINANPAISACTGLLNGPMFRRFTFRQVAMAGSLLVFTGILLTAFCESFLSYMIAYSVLFGFGMGISVSASSLAVNTYFKNKRRRAAGFSWTITGLGPIVLPYVVTFLLSVYGVQGTVLIFAAISLHSFFCALIFQPVRYHVANCCSPDVVLEMQVTRNEERGVFSSQYLYQEDDERNPGFEIMEPGTPMLSRANDGWFGSQLSLASGRVRLRSVSSSKELEGSLKVARLAKLISEEEPLRCAATLKPNNFNRERVELLKHSTDRSDLRDSKIHILVNSNNNNNDDDGEKGNFIKRKEDTESKQFDDEEDSEEERIRVLAANLSFLQKVVAFFDLDLLRDFTFVNLVAGLTIINFGELNFAILTPFILDDFGFDTSQITCSMSVLASLDITMRFLAPFLTEKIAWDNRVFFLIGVVGIALGRTVVACTRSFPVILTCFAFIGIFKGVRTIFWPLIIPSCVPLKRLPAASGLQLLISGVFTLAAGPFVGLVRDNFNYSVTLHCLNCMSFAAAISWALEALVRHHLCSSHSQKGDST